MVFRMVCELQEAIGEGKVLERKLVLGRSFPVTPVPCWLLGAAGAAGFCRSSVTSGLLSSRFAPAVFVRMLYEGGVRGETSCWCKPCARWSLSKVPVLLETLTEDSHRA